jgi:hypothetical protein
VEDVLYGLILRLYVESKTEYDDLLIFPLVSKPDVLAIVDCKLPYAKYGLSLVKTLPYSSPLSL